MATLPIIDDICQLVRDRLGSGLFNKKDFFDIIKEEKYGSRRDDYIRSIKFLSDCLARILSNSVDGSGRQVVAIYLGLANSGELQKVYFSKRETDEAKVDDIESNFRSFLYYCKNYKTNLNDYNLEYLSLDEKTSG